jgi:proton glutamate symport protein
MKKIPLHTRILIGLAIGLVWGLLSVNMGIPSEFTSNFIKPFGTIFVNLLKMIAVPLVLASLVVGVASLKDMSKLSRIGGKTIAIYTLTTLFATTIGILIVNIINPGSKLSESTRNELLELYSTNAEKSLNTASQLKSQSVLKPLVDMIPDNIFIALSDNTKMLQVVFFAIFLGIALIQISPSKSKVVTDFFDALNDAIIKLVEIIMLFAPIGVFALIGSLIVDLAGSDPSKALDLLYALLWYGITVILGLLILVFLLYGTLIKFFTKVPLLRYFKEIRPVQLLAFSTSSSNATLPLTMERCEKGLGIKEEITSFVLPLGATINMDGTSLYQAVAAVFIAQAMNIDLTLGEQITIVMTATLASIGSAGVPGAGMVMLVIVLEAVGIPSAGLALIIAIDRILDMCRSVVNVTGDTMVATIIATGENEIKLPAENND